MFSACCRVAFINEYTRYCPKCGQECGIEYKETIPWIKCSERMPPDDDSNIILKQGKHLTICAGWFPHKALTKYMEWIPYDEATWRELKCLKN
jgi:hypothetical protein